MEHRVVGTVEPLALIVVDERPLAASNGQYRDPPVAMLAREQTPLWIEQQTIAARFGPIVGDTGVPGRFEEQTGSFALDPLVNRVAGNVRKQKMTRLVTTGRHPDGALGPVEPGGDHLQPRIGRNKFVEIGLVAMDLTQRRKVERVLRQNRRQTRSAREGRK